MSSRRSMKKRKNEREESEQRSEKDQGGREMAATSDEQMQLLLSTFDHIYEDSKNGIAEIHLLKSNLAAEIKKREALEITCNNLNQDNERLRKCYTESLNNLAAQLQHRAKCQSMEEQLKRMSDEHLINEDEYRKTMELLKQDYTTKINDLEAQIRGFLREKASNEATISQLQQDLAAHKTHIQAIANRSKQLFLDVESQYHPQIQDLKDCLLLEQEEKNELNKKLQNLEKELLVSRTKLVEQQRDVSSKQHLETFKLKMMKLRKENEVLKKRLSNLKEG